MQKYVTWQVLLPESLVLHYLVYRKSLGIY